MKILACDENRIRLLAEPTPGVYRIIRAGEIIYAGMSGDVLTRANNFHPQIEPGDVVEITLTANAAEAAEIEAAEIAEHRPRENKTVPPTPITFRRRVAHRKPAPQESADRARERGDRISRKYGVY